jgi:pimeloyl-ACP methyl ester carboxylesterase
MKVRWIQLFLASIALLVLVACPLSEPVQDEVTVTISPEAVTLAPGETQEFTATVTGTSNMAVTWSASAGIVEGTDSTIIYTAPDEIGSYTVAATSIADSSKSASAEVVVDLRPPSEQNTQTLGPDGGLIEVESGSFAYVEAGALTSSVEVTLSTFATPIDEYLPVVEAIARQTQIELPLEAVDLEEDHLFYIAIPSSAVSEGAETLAEVRITLADGSDFTYVTNYHPTEEDVITISTAELNILFEVYAPPPSNLKIAVQPLDISALPDLFTPIDEESELATASESFSRITGMFTVEDEYQDGHGACDSKNEVIPATVPRTQLSHVPADKTPIILIHGWQEFTIYKPFPWHRQKSSYNPALCGWRDFIYLFLQDQDTELKSKYALFTFGYDSSKSVQFNASSEENPGSLRTYIDRFFGGRDVVLIGHSMGGLVGNTYIRQNPNNRVHHLITLGTPYRGSRPLLCVEENGERCTRVRALAGLSGYLENIANVDGTKDLAWEFGGFSYSTTQRCFNPNPPYNICTVVKESVSNTFLTRLNADMRSSDYENYTAFYAVAPPASTRLFGLTSRYIRRSTGLLNDGIVTTQSACLSRSTGQDNDCSQMVFHSTNAEMFEMDHYDINSSLTYGSIRTRLLQNVPPSATGTIVASVKDAVTDQSLSQVAISITPSSPSATVHEAPTGTYTVSRVPVGEGYRLTFIKPGYLTATYNNVIVQEDETTFLEQLLFIDESRNVPANASGFITDALTGQGVSGVSVNLRSGLGTTSGPVVTSTTTASSGAYSFSSLNAGYYTAEASRSGYITGYFTITVIGGQSNSNQNTTISPDLPLDQWRIVLTWGATPRDLDSHLTGPTADGSGNRFHVYYPLGSRRYAYNGVTYVDLDRDDTMSYGPETITIYQLTGGEGVYRYSVHNYSNRSSTSSTALANSGAQVRVYQGAALVRTYYVPNEEGTLWTVFELDFTRSDPIVPVNRMSYESMPSRVQSIGEDYLATDAHLLQHLPDKERLGGGRAL